MYNIKDNVVALATSVGPSAINVVRCSGPDVLNIAQRITNKKKPLKANFCFVSFIKNPQTKEVIDQCLVTPFIKPKSYTGQNMVEFSIHGGNTIYQKMIKLLSDEGCRIAEKGEFTYRAFVNGKIDLIQAESIANIVSSNSSLDVKYSLGNLKGALSKTIEKLCQKLKNIIIYMEHELDFNEEEIKHKTYKEYQAKLNQLVDDINKIINHSFVGSLKSGDVKIVICGATNAGKSSLFNYLAGYQRSIVTNISGTTRDTVEILLNLNNINVSLVDTAGIRKTKDIVEIKGIQRTYKTISSADIVLFIDEKDPIGAFKKLNLKIKKKKVVFVKNKIDLIKPKETPGVFNVSCKERVGGDKILTHLSTLVEQHKELFIKEHTFVASERVLQILTLFIKKIKASQELFDKKVELAIIVSSLYDCLDLFITTISPSEKEEIINKIFKGFCVGK